MSVMPSVDEEVAFAGAARIAEMVRAKEVSPTELVELYLDRIGRIEPKLNAYRVVLGEQAQADAKRAIEELRAAVLRDVEQGDGSPAQGIRPRRRRHQRARRGVIRAHVSHRTSREIGVQSMPTQGPKTAENLLHGVVDLVTGEIVGAR